MKHCNFCNVDIEDKKVHCPLCGKCLDEKKVKSGIVNHSNIYPDYHLKANTTQLVCKIIIRCLFALTLFCFAVDLLVNYTISFSLIVGIGFLLCYFAILRPIKKFMPIENAIITISITTSLFLLFIELYTHSYGWGVNIAIPSIWVGLSLLSFILMLVKGYMDGDMLKPIILNAILNMVLLVLLFSFKQFATVSIIAFLVNIAIIIFTLIFKFKFTSKSIKKQFRF